MQLESPGNTCREQTRTGRPPWESCEKQETIRSSLFDGVAGSSGGGRLSSWRRRAVWWALSLAAFASRGPFRSPVPFELRRKCSVPPHAFLAASGCPRGRCRARRGGFVPCSGMARLSSPRTRGHASADVRGLGRLVGVACLPRMGCPAEAELCSPSAFEIVHRTFETLGRFINRVANLRL